MTTFFILILHKLKFFNLLYFKNSFKIFQFSKDFKDNAKKLKENTNEAASYIDCVYVHRNLEVLNVDYVKLLDALCKMGNFIFFKLNVKKFVF